MPTRDRGLLCNCLCPECARPLVAHLGENKAWHFQHHTEDAGCSPRPMSLLHAFVRDELASRLALTVPLVERQRDIEFLNRRYRALVSVPLEEFKFTKAQAEARGDGVQPDVLYTLPYGVELALEVKYTHAVDEAKKLLLQRNYAMAVEFDVSDLPAAGIGIAQLEQALIEPHRWNWLCGSHVRHSELRVVQQMTWVRGQWRVVEEPSFAVNPHPAPTRLAQAAKRMGWAREKLKDLREQGIKGVAGAQWLGRQDKVDRVSVACAALGISPMDMPDFLLQRPTREMLNLQTLTHHPYSWQPVVFMKFGIGKNEFSAMEASDWCVLALPDRCEYEDGAVSLNGLTRTAARLHLYFLQLETQGWLTGVPSHSRESRRFRPKFSTAEQFREAVAKYAREKSNQPRVMVPGKD